MKLADLHIRRQSILGYQRDKTEDVDSCLFCCSMRPLQWAPLWALPMHPSVSQSRIGSHNATHAVYRNQQWRERFPRQEWLTCQCSAQKVKRQGHRTPDVKNLRSRPLTSDRRRVGIFAHCRDGKFVRKT